jgi:hypothetical protein
MKRLRRELLSVLFQVLAYINDIDVEDERNEYTSFPVESVLGTLCEASFAQSSFAANLECYATFPQTGC